MDNKSYSHNSSNEQTRKKYNRLTAQIIKNAVKKEISNVRKHGKSAAESLLTSLEDSLQKSLLQSENNARSSRANGRYINNSNFAKRNIEKADVPPSKSDNIKESGSLGENSAIYNEIAATLAEGMALADKLRRGETYRNDMPIGELILNILKTNKDVWSDFIVKLAKENDVESLAVFGTNLIYGGFITETAENEPNCSYIELTDSKQNENLGRAYSNADKTYSFGARTQSLIKILQNDARLGKRVCIIKGEGLLANDLERIYRNFSDTAFILVEKQKKGEKINLSSGVGAKNLLYIPEFSSKNDVNSFSTLPSSILNGIMSLYGTDEASTRMSSERHSFDEEVSKERGREEGSAKKYSSVYEKGGGAARLTFGSRTSAVYDNISYLFSFLSSPALPIITDTNTFLSLICELEAALSGGKNVAPAKYFI